MGAVYRVQREGVQYALKVLSGQGRVDDERFLREAEAVAQVDRHPNIARIHLAGEDDGRAFLVFDLIEGKSLREILDTEPPWDLERSLRCVEHLANALAHIHSHGILHRDLKPDNILIRQQDGEPLLVDFGLARFADGETLTKTCELLGTPLYMAPEQAGTDRESYGPATDIWALGVILYELCLGCRPFEEDSILILIRRILLDHPPAPRSLKPSLPEGVEAIIMRCLAKEPDDRYPSADALANDIARVRRGDLVEGAHRNPLARILRRHRRPLLVTLALLAPLILTLAAWLGSARSHRRRRAEELQRQSQQLRKTFRRTQAELEAHIVAHALAAHHGQRPDPDLPACLHAAEALRRSDKLEEALDANADLPAVQRLLASGGFAEVRSQRSFMARLESLKVTELGTITSRDNLIPALIDAILHRRRDEAGDQADKLLASPKDAPLSRFVALPARILQQRWRAADQLLESLLNDPAWRQRVSPLELLIRTERIAAALLAEKSDPLPPLLEGFRRSAQGREDPPKCWQTLTDTLVKRLVAAKGRPNARQGYDRLISLKTPEISLQKLPPKLHGDFADEAAASFRDSPSRLELEAQAFFHYLLRRQSEPEFPLPKGYRPADVSRLLDKEETLARGFGLLLAASRAGVYIGLKADAIGKLASRGLLDQLIQQRPRDPFPRFWRGLSSMFLAITAPGGKRAWFAARIADLRFSLAHPRLPPAFRAKALTRKVHLELTLAKSGSPTSNRRALRLSWLRDLDSAAKLPHPSPDEIPLWRFHVLTRSTDPKVLIQLLDEAERGLRDRRRRSLEGTLALGQPFTCPLQPLSQARLNQKLSTLIGERAEQRIRDGDFKASLREYQALVELSPSPPVVQSCGHLLLRLRRFDLLQKLLSRFHFPSLGPLRAALAKAKTEE